MQGIFGLLKNRVEQLLAEGAADRAVAWKKGDFFYDPSPAIFQAGSPLDGFIYDGFCAAGLSKYLVEESRKDGKILALLKPCDTYGFNQLVKEHRIQRENVYVLGIECQGMLDMEKIKALGVKGALSMEENGEELVFHTLYGEKTCLRSEVLLEKCLCCKGKQHMVYDELLSTCTEEPFPAADRFARVKELEAMTPDQRFAFWQSELSRCIRCNACRNACPACTCIQCVFDNNTSGVAGKANADPSEENLFHLVRAFHVAGRCTDCGECARVCPRHIPLHLLNRKMIKDINEFYGEYQAGAGTESGTPLTCFTREDAEPGIVSDKGGEL